MLASYVAACAVAMLACTPNSQAYAHELPGTITHSLAAKRPTRISNDTDRITSMQIVTKPTEWKGGLVAISNFGFGGSNVHCILGGSAGRARAGLAIAPAVEDAKAEKAEEVT